MPVIVRVKPNHPTQTRGRDGHVFNKAGTPMPEADVTDAIRNDPCLEILSEEVQKAEVEQKPETAKCAKKNRKNK